jgi:hypothetical protein
MGRSSQPFTGALVVAGIVCVVGAAACTSPLGTSTTGTATTTASTYTPVTGIEVDAHSLFLRVGCGTSAGQGYKYAVVVQSRPGLGVNACPSGAEQVVGVGVYDCFADAVFVNLGGGSDGGLSGGSAVGLSRDFDLAIAAFDAPTFASQAGVVGSAVSDLAANSCSSSPVDDRVASLLQVASWTTTCEAHQAPSVQSLAACDPLVAAGSSSSADAGTD